MKETTGYYTRFLIFLYNFIKGENSGVSNILWRIGFHRSIVYNRGSAAFLLYLSEGVLSRLLWAQVSRKERVSEGFRSVLLFFQVVTSSGCFVLRDHPGDCRVLCPEFYHE